MTQLTLPSQTHQVTNRQQTLRILGEPPFIGRINEVHQILQLLDATGQGYGQVVVINGPAGVGKTRLAEEVATLAQRRGAKVAVGRCWGDGEAPPLWPWRMLLRELNAPEHLLADHQPETTHGRFARFV